MMDELIQKFPAQITESLAIGENISLQPHPFPLYSAFMAGMGGSGIGGRFVKEFIADECAIPYEISNSYDIPAHVGKNTLFIASSYSGNTEETVSALEKAAHTGAKIVCIASGGKILDMARVNNWDHIAIPAGWPSPRACLGYSMIQQLFVLQKLGFISDRVLRNIKTAGDLINFDQDEIKNKAEKIAQILHGKLAVLYTTDRMEAVALRWRQQLNENAKLLAWHHVVPEMNHNEIVGWKDAYAEAAVIYLRNRDDFGRNAVRIDINKEVIFKLSNTIVDIYSKGQSLAEKALYFVHLGDWVSYYLAELRGVDSMEVDVIDHLKAELSKIS